MIGRALLLVVVAAVATGCAADVSAASECKPIQDRCDGDVIQTCQPDVDLIQRGQYLYRWTDVLTCDDDAVLGDYTCFETLMRDGRVEASCELERDVAAWGADAADGDEASSEKVERGDR